MLGCSAALVVLAVAETTLNKGSHMYRHIWLNVLVGISVACVPLAILGTAYVMGAHPFWLPREFIPIIGMLIGNCVSAIALGVHHSLRYFSDNRERIEWLLALGATRWEAGALPLASLRPPVLTMASFSMHSTAHCERRTARCYAADA